MNSLYKHISSLSAKEIARMPESVLLSKIKHSDPLDILMLVTSLAAQKNKESK